MGSAGEVVVRVLGPFSVTAGERAAGPWQRPSARRLCELVLASPGRRVSREVAREELFPGLDPQAASRALSKALSMARTALAELGEPGASLLSADLTHIWAAPDAVIDAAVQADALRAALALAPGAERDAALVGALAEEGELLADEPYADWAADPRERLETLRHQARLTLARDRSAGAGQPGPEAVTAAWLAVFDRDPASEEAAAALLRCYLRPGSGGLGHRELAARAYERHGAALADLGLSISPAVASLYAAVGDGDSAQAPVAAAAAEPVSGTQATPAREELRTITVLSAEVGTSAATAADPESLREVVGAALAAVIAEVEALGGLVTTVSGNGLQAMFGAPRAHEDDPERAARAAYRALAAVAAAADGAWLRIGVESGPALVGPVGAGGKVEYGAVGEVVSVTATLQSLASPATALVGPATRAAVEHLFSWGSGVPLTTGAGAQASPAGLAGPQPAGQPQLTASYLGEPVARGAQRRLEARGPLVGRAAELKVLDAALRDAVRGQGGMLVLRGEPGLGKSRLVQETRRRFLAWAGAREGRLPLWLEGRAASYGSATPYWVYQQLLAGWLGVAPDQPRQLVHAALERAVSELMASTELLPLLEHVMGLPPAAAGNGAPGGRDQMIPEELREAAFGALRTVISRLAPARRPAVIVLEDLHWADPTSLRFTRELIPLTTRRPLLILATTRPEAGLEGRPDSGVELGSLLKAGGVRTIELRPLPDEAGRELAGALVGASADKDVIDAALAGTDGNPLFLEERVSALLETGALTRERGQWWLNTAAGPTVPQVLDRLVRSRIDRLSQAAQEVIRLASVLGAEFPLSLLATVCRLELPALGEAGVEAVLDELCDRNLLRQAPGSAEAAFRFRHALIQEAAYAGLLRADRRRLHGRAAAALEASSGSCLDEVGAVLGRHFAAAGDDAAAVRYLELAADNATRAFANDEAITVYTEALTVASSAADADAGARLQAKLANVLWRTARREETRAAFRAALRLADTLPAPEPARKAHLLTRLGRLEMHYGQPSTAVRAFDEASALLDPLVAAAPPAGTPGTRDYTGAEADVADLWLELMIEGRASMQLYSGDFDGAAATLEAARPLLEARGTPARRYGFYEMLAMHRVEHAQLQSDEQAIADMRRALAAAEASRDTKDIGYGSYLLGWTLWLHGDMAEADVKFRAALAIAERVGEAMLLSNSLGSLVHTALARHDITAVRELSPRAVAAAAQIGGDQVIWATAPLAWLAWQEGRADDVRKIAAEIDGHAAGAGIGDAGDDDGTGKGKDGKIAMGTRYRSVYLLPLIAVSLDAGDTGAAVTAARQILSRGQARLPPALHGELEGGYRAWDAAQPDEAAARLAAAVTLGRELGFC